MEVGKIEGNIHSFKWVVDISSFTGKKTGQKLLSPHLTYVSTEGLQLKWQVILFPKGAKKNFQKYLSLYLKSLNKNKVSTRFSISLLDQDDDRREELEDQSTFSFDSDRGWAKFAKENIVLDPRNHVLKDNKLTFLISIMIEEKTFIENFMKEETKEGILLKHLEKFKTLFLSEELSDVTVETQKGKHMKLHKCILAASSEVFKTMFKADMKEKFENKVEIKDIRDEVLEELFKYIYTAEVSNLKTMAGELFMAAEKYCVEDLKEACQKQMCLNLGQFNAVEYLNLAILYNVKELEEEATKYISKHVPVLIKDRIFENLAKLHPKVYHKIMINFFNNNPQL